MLKERLEKIRQRLRCLGGNTDGVPEKKSAFERTLEAGTLETDAGRYWTCKEVRGHAGRAMTPEAQIQRSVFD